MNESLYSRYFNPTGGLFVKKYPIKYAKYNAINASIILLGATNFAFRFTNPTIPPIKTSINPIGTNFGEKHKKLMIPVIVLFGVSSCSGVEVVGADAEHIWIRNPLLSITSSDKLAQEHCTRYGKTAVKENNLSIGDSGDSILVYACQ